MANELRISPVPEDVYKAIRYLAVQENKTIKDTLLWVVRDGLEGKLPEAMYPTKKRRK